MKSNFLRGIDRKLGSFLPELSARKSTGERWAITVISLLVTFGLRSALQPWLEYEAQYVVFVPAVILIVLCSGIAHSIIASVAAVLLVRIFFVPPGPWEPHVVHDIVAVLAFIGSAMIVAGLANAVNRERERAVAHAMESKRRAEELQVEIDRRISAEIALRESQAKLRAIADQSPSAITVKDREGRYMLVNRAFQAMTRRTAAQITGKMDAELFPAVDAATFRANDAKVLNLGVPLEFEEIYFQDDGPHTAIVQKFPLRDEQGTIYGIGGIVTDITRRKQIEEELRVAEQAYADLVRGIDGILWEADAYNYKFSFVSQKAERLFLYPIDAWLTEPEFWKNHLHPDDREKTVRMCVQATNEKRPHDLEYRMIAADGRVVWVRDIVNIVIEHDQPVKLRGVMVDITREREAQEALRRSEELLRMTTEAAGIGLWSWDVINDNLEWNSAEYQQCAVQVTSGIRLQTFLDLVHAEDRARIKQEIDTCVQQGCDLDIEYRIVRPDGTIRWRRCKGRPTFVNGRAVRVSGMSLDITEKKAAEEELKAARDTLARHAEELEERVKERTEQLEKALKDMEGFCYSIAHDLRAPVRAMRGLSQALVEDYSDRIDDMGKQYCTRISAASDRMDQLISDLLAFGRLSHLELPSAPVNLVAEIERVIEHSEQQLQEKQAEIDIDRSMPPVRCDARVLDQVLENLVNNALKFVPPERRPHVHIFAERRDSRVRVWVEDNGIGIEPQYRERIFGAFQRLHTADVYPGTGIGLAIVKKGVEKMGGDVGVESEPGLGSRFWIELPAADLKTEERPD